MPPSLSGRPSVFSPAFSLLWLLLSTRPRGSLPGSPWLPAAPRLDELSLLSALHLSLVLRSSSDVVPSPLALNGSLPALLPGFASLRSDVPLQPFVWGSLLHLIFSPTGAWMLGVYKNLPSRNQRCRLLLYKSTIHKHKGSILEFGNTYMRFKTSKEACMLGLNWN
jgi:hypothetical protein